MTCDLSTVKSKHTGRWPGLFSMVLVFLAELAGVQRGSPKRLDGQDTQRPPENRRKGYPTRGADGNLHTLRNFPWLGSVIPSLGMREPGKDSVVSPVYGAVSIYVFT